MSTVVATQALTKRYGSKTAVNDVSFDLGDREVLGLLGPNGSGKSTVLRLITGYLAPSSGTAEVAGFDIVSQSRAARDCVGYVPEDVPLYPHMRVEEFLIFMGRMRGLTGRALSAAIDAACERLNLAPMRGLMIGNLSRGYRQRVAIAQALLHSPKLLVLDEPTNGLDPRQIIELRLLVRALADRCAVLVTSHVLTEIERVAHRAAILVDGCLLHTHTVHTPSAEQRVALRLRLRASDRERVGRVLARVPGLAHASLESVTADVSEWLVDGRGDALSEQIAQAMVGQGIGIVELCHAASDLEAVFLRLTASHAAAPLPEEFGCSV